MTMIHGFQARHEPGLEPTSLPLLLLHGTGGDENDLIEFGRMVAPRAPLLGLRGQVKEGFANRWFRRMGEGVFDLDDLERRAADLAEAVRAAGVELGFAGKPVAVGFSNGANIASALLLRHPGVLGGAVLMRAMDTLPPAEGLDLAGLGVLLLNGAQDPMAPAASREALVRSLRGAGADIVEQVTAPGHGLTMNDVNAARAWLAPRLSAAA